MENTKLIVFSAPAGVGKDVCIKYLQDKGYDLIRAECKDHLHELTISYFKVDKNLYWNTYYNRALKEIPSELFTLDKNSFDELCCYLDMDNTEGRYYQYGYKISIREALIFVSEIIYKPLYGSDYFGVNRANKLVQGKVHVDGSFMEVAELEPVIGVLGKENILAIRLHRDDYSFEGDSRSYIPDGVAGYTVDIYNNSTLQDMFNKVEYEVDKFLHYEKQK